MARKKSPQFDLSQPVTNLDGDCLSPGQLAVTARKAEIISLTGGPDDGPELKPTYLEGPCPAWRAIKHALVAQEIDRNDEGTPIGIKKITEEEKAERYDLANYISREGAKDIKCLALTDDKTVLRGETSDIELITERCSVVFGIEAFGFIKDLLKNPLEVGDEEEAEEEEAEEEVEEEASKPTAKKKGGKKKKKRKVK